MARKDLYAQVAHLHAVGIDRGFLTTLGEGFLALMYQAIDETPGAVLLTEVEGPRVLGFVTGATGMGPIYRQMLRHAPRLALALAPVLLNPVKLWRIWEILRRKSETTETGPLPEFELLSIAVAPEARRHGVARRLYDGLKAHAASEGHGGFRIVVGEGLEAAHRFYTGMGAEPAATITLHGTDRSTLYVQRV